MIIIVEGLDHTGKTTLCHKLLQELQGSYLIHAYKPTELMYPVEENVIFLNNHQGLCIHDRHNVFSEFVYGPILRGSNVMEQGYSFEDWMGKMANSCIVIYCRPSAKIISETINNREEMDGVQDNFGELLVAYDDLMWRLMQYNQRTPMDFQVPMMVHDYTVDTEADDVLEFCYKHINFMLETKPQFPVPNSPMDCPLEKGPGKNIRKKSVSVTNLSGEPMKIRDLYSELSKEDLHKLRDLGNKQVTAKYNLEEKNDERN